MKYFVILLVIVGFISIANAQYAGNVEFYHKSVNTGFDQHSVLMQSESTKFTKAMFDQPAEALIFSISTSSDVIDTATITMNKQTMSQLFSGLEDDPSNMVLLINGEVKPYRIIADNKMVSWMFYVPTESTQIELIPPTSMFGPVKSSEDIPFNVLRTYPPVKQNHVGVSYEDIKCKQNLVLLQKYDDSPACVTESTKLKLIERGWAAKDSGIKCDNNDDFDLVRFSESDDIHPQRLVAFLKEGTTGVICLQYISNLDNEGFFDIDESLHQRDSSDEVSSNVVLNAIPNKVSREYGTDVTVAYEIHAKNNSTGIYWINLSQLCDSLPVVVWDKEPRVSGDDIPVATGIRHCPAKFLDVNIIGYSGLDLQYHSAKPT